MIGLDKIREEAEVQSVSSEFVLKEYIHLFVLEYLFKEGYFSKIVFQGGTALRLAYGGVRYSEDLDFVLNKKDNKFFKGLSKGALDKLPGHLDKLIPFAKAIELKAQKDTQTFKRFSLSLELEGFKAKNKTNIEFANVPSYENQVVILKREGIPIAPAITVETPQEILSDKFVALAFRDYIKGRDIWDIHFILTTLKVALDKRIEKMITRKVVDYGMNLKGFISGFEKNLAILRENGEVILKEEMDKFLPPTYRAAFSSKYNEITSFVASVSGGVLKGIARR